MRLNGEYLMLSQTERSQLLGALDKSLCNTTEIGEHTNDLLKRLKVDFLNPLSISLNEIGDRDIIRTVFSSMGIAGKAMINPSGKLPSMREFFQSIDKLMREDE